MSAIKIFRAEFPTEASALVERVTDILLGLLDPHSGRRAWNRPLFTPSSDDHVVRLIGERGQGNEPEVEELRLLVAAQGFGGFASTMTLVFEVMEMPLDEHGVDMPELHLENASAQAITALGQAFPEVRWQSAQALCDDHDLAGIEKRMADLGSLATLPPGPPRKAHYLAPDDDLPHADLAKAGMRGGLGRVRDALLIALDMPEGQRRHLVNAALAMASELPVEIEAKGSGELHDVAEAFEHPRFRFLLKAGVTSSVPVLPSLAEIARMASGSVTPPSGGFLPSHPQNRLLRARRRREEDRRLDEVRRPYFQGLKEGNSLVLRARGLAMVFPHLPVFGRDWLIDVIALALKEVRSNAVAKAIGLLSLLRVADEIDRQGTANVRFPDTPVVSGKLAAPLVDALSRAVGEVGDPALRARLCLQASAFLPDPQRGEAIRTGQAALRELERGSATVSDASRAEIAWIGLGYAGLLASPSWQPSEDDRFLEKASIVARMVRDPLRKAQLLLALVRRGSPPDTFASRLSDMAFQEAVTTLDTLVHQKADGIEWYAGFRARNPDDRLDPDAPAVMDMSAPRAASVALGLSGPPIGDKPVNTVIQDWAVAEVNAWLERSLPDAWPSLTAVRFPLVLSPQKAAIRREAIEAAKASAKGGQLRG